MGQDDAALPGPDDSYNEHPPAKKGKALPAASADQPTRPVPRPVQKKPQVVQEEETMDPPNRHNAKKRPSEAADPENDPKTLVPSKKAKVGLNEKSKSAPLRRTGKPIFLFCLNEVDKGDTRNNDRVSWIEGGYSKTY
jgi:hypothetical protein